MLSAEQSKNTALTIERVSAETFLFYQFGGCFGNFWCASCGCTGSMELKFEAFYSKRVENEKVANFVLFNIWPVGAR